MLIQNASSTAAPPVYIGDSGAVAVAAPRAQAGPVELPRVAVQSVPEQLVVTDAQLKKTVDTLNRAMQQSNSNIEFSIDQDTKQTVIKVTETGTGKVIRQFPSEEIMAVSRMIAEAQRGALVQQKA